MAVFHIDHVLSTRLVRSSIFDDLVARNAAAAAPGARVTRSLRPDRAADVHHYHRANLEMRLLPRSIATVHHDPLDPRPSLALTTFLPRYREARIVHCLNTAQAATLAAHGIHRTRVIPHGVDRRVLPPPERPRSWHGGRLRLGLFSRRYADGVKGEETFPGLLAHLDPVRVSFVLVGEGRRQEAQAARERGFPVESWEYLPYRLMREAVAAIDALLIISRFEGGPASLPEALGSGVPILCTPVGMCRDFARGGENCLELSGDPKSDGERILALLDDDGRGVRRLAEGAFAGAGEIPSWNEVMAEWHRLYAEAAQ
jgi:glycosyltransferase involved in cell wall biosynthesis